MKYTIKITTPLGLFSADSIVASEEAYVNLMETLEAGISTDACIFINSNNTRLMIPSEVAKQSVIQIIKYDD